MKRKMNLNIMINLYINISIINTSITNLQLKLINNLSLNNLN